MYRAENFSHDELVPPDTARRFGASSYRFISPLLAITIQQLRNKFGRFIVNRPEQGLDQRALRTPAFYVEEEGLSIDKAREKFDLYMGMHKFGCAVDSTPLDTPLEEIIDYIKEHPDEFPFLSFVEIDRSWLHLDVRNMPDITFWSPERGIVYVAKQKPIDWGLIAPGLN